MEGGDDGDDVVVLMIWVEVEKLGGVEMVEMELKDVGGGGGEGDGGVAEVVEKVWWRG